MSQVFLKDILDSAPPKLASVGKQHVRVNGFVSDSRVFSLVSKYGGSRYIGDFFDPRRVARHHVIQAKLRLADSSEPTMRLHVEILEVKGTRAPPVREVLGVVLRYVWELNRLLAPPLRHAEIVLGIAFFPEPKRFPSAPGTPLSPAHVNSGVTFHSSTEPFCVVFRKEEWRKVLLHELYHLHEHFLPVRGADVLTRYEEKLAKDLSIRSETGVRIMEAFTEALTTLTYIPLYFRDDIGKDWHALQRAYDLAADVAVKKAAAVMQHYATSSEWHEQTHAYSYYVVKAALLFHHRAFVAWVDQTGCRVGISTPDQHHSFVQRLDAWLKDRAFAAALEESMNPRSNAFLKKSTLAMLLPDATFRKLLKAYKLSSLIP